MISTTKIEMDVSRNIGKFVPSIDVVQDDRYSRNIEITVLSNGTAVSLIEKRALIRYVKADGTGGNYDALPDGTPAFTISGNVLTVALAPQVCTFPGIVKMVVAIIDGETYLHTFPLDIKVHRNPGLQIVSENYLKMLGAVPDSGWPANMYLGTDEKGNVIAKESSAGGGGSDCVSYSPQTLTPDQQEQARKNIDALKVPRGIARELFFFGEHDDFQTYGNQRIYKIAGQQVWLNSPADFDFRVRFNITRNLGQVEEYAFTKSDCTIIETVQGRKHWRFFANVSGSSSLVLTVANGIDPGSFESEPYCSLIYPSDLENYSVEFFKLSETEQELNLVTSVNGIQADENGNVTIETGGGSTQEEVYVLSPGETVENAPKDVKIVINPNEEAPAYVQTVNGVSPDKNGNVVVSGGGSGGGAQSDWNAKEGEPGHVLNRTHWADVTLVEFLSECNPTYNADQNAYVAMATAVPAVGDTYTIRWNGVDYVCIAQDASVVMPGAVGFGNGENFGLASNGEPFAVLFVNQGGMVVAMVMPFDGSEEITLAAYKHEENVHKLDNKYIDSEWMATIVDGRGTPALEEQALTFSVSDDSMTYTWNRASAEVMPSVEDGKTYIIAVDGVEYTATAKLNADSSDNAIRLTVGTSIDFWAYTNGVISMLHLVGYGTNPVHMVGIYEKAKVPNKLPAKFLPDNQSGSADWNATEYEAGHIRNRTHYDEIVKLLPLSVFSVKDPELGYVEEFIYDYEPVLVDGETYTVTWNGVEYSCVASLWEEQDGTIPVDELSCITLGDRTISGDAEPFLIGYFPSLKMLYLTDILAVETISASITKPNFKKLDNKFLDMTWFPNEPYQNKQVGTGRVKTAQHPTYGAFCIQKTFTELVAFPEMVDVTFDSTLYGNLKFTYIEGLGHLAGNLSMMNSLMGTSYENTGEPFLLLLNISDYTLFTQDTAATYHTHKVLAKNIATPNKMPEKFMPESVSGIIVRSSTEGSTKKFKLTVDDSGTIAATEV